MAKIFFEAEEKLILEAENILDNEGLDLEVAIHILLKRIVKEQTIRFLLKNNYRNVMEQERREEEKNISTDVSIEKNYIPTVAENFERVNMTKSIAIRLFRSKGFSIGNNVTYASKNRGAYNYWANPEFGMLSSEWDLILNDWINRKIYLFTIPANSIMESQLTSRSDKKYLIDLQIAYDDITFTDNRSNVSFAKYLVAEIKY